MGINIIWYDDDDKELGRTYISDKDTRSNMFAVPSNHPTKGQFFFTTEPVLEEVYANVTTKTSE